KISGPLFFGVAKKFEDTVLHALSTKPKGVILDLSNVPFVDATGEDILQNLLRDLTNEGISVYLTNVGNVPYQFLQKGLLSHSNEKVQVFKTNREAILYFLNKNEEH